MKKLLFAFFIIVVLINIIPEYSKAAGGPPLPPGGGGGPPCGSPWGCVPIDGGIGFLLAAGIAYGGKKAYKTFKEDK